MDIQQIRQIYITDYLQQQGYTPARIKGIKHWYHSPFWQEHTHSFKKSTRSAICGTTSVRMGTGTS